MNHYVYRLTCAEGFFYVGCRSCWCEPVDDTNYTGSGKRLARAKEMGMVFMKEILCIYDTREEALQHERDEVDNLNPWSLNLHPGGIEPKNRRSDKGRKRKPRTKPNSNKGKPWSAARRAVAGNEGRPRKIDSSKRKK